MMGARMLGKLQALTLRRLSVSQRFALLSFFCVLAITVLVCAASSAVLRRQLVEHDGAVIGDLASRLFTSSVPAEFFEVPSGAPPASAARLREFARSEQVVRFMVYDADGWVLWSDDASLTDHHFGENTKVAAALRGETIAEIGHPGAEGHHSTLRGFPRLEEVYTPVRYQSNGPIVGVIELYRAPATLFAVLDHGVVVVWVLGGIAGAILYLTLVTVAWNCYRTQIRLETELAGYARILEARVDERTRELAQKAKYLSILYAVSSALGRSLETREILGRALDELADGKGFDGGWIQLLPDENDTMPPMVRRGISEEIVQRFTARADAVARSGQACVVALEETSDAQSGTAEWARGLVFAPIGVGDRPLGALAVAGPGVDRFTPDDTQLLSSVGRQIGVAIGNARLYATTREREREARILFETTGRFGELTDCDALLKAIVEGAVSLTRASYGGTGFPDGDDMVMHRLVAPEQGAVVRLKIVECLAGLTFTSGAPQVANDAAQDSRVNRASARSLRVRNLACVPLQHRGRVIGVLFVGNKEIGPFTEQDVVRLRTFAHHAAVALENARLLHETKSTKEYLENLIASSVDAIVTLDPRGRITFVSRGGQCMFGCAEDGELIGRQVRALWACGPRDFRRFRARLVRAGRVENYETELAMDTGGRLVVNISASFLRGAEGEVTGVLAVVKDVTSLRRLHEQIVRSERLAAAGLLAAGVAHEVGNPLTCISALAQVLMARTSDKAILDGLENIEVHVGRISRIVQDLTRLTRPAPATLREASVGNLVDTAVSLARHNPAVRRMKMDSVVDPALPAVRVAPDHLVQVFLNLILNAADSGGNLTIRAVGAGGAIRVIFEDTGCGMTAEEKRRLFDPFHSTKDNETHLGLGLFVSHEIVRQHGGDLLVESQPGVGATVTVVLPVEPLPAMSEELV